MSYPPYPNSNNAMPAPPTFSQAPPSLGLGFEALTNPSQPHAQAGFSGYGGYAPPAPAYPMPPGSAPFTNTPAAMPPYQATPTFPVHQSRDSRYGSTYSPQQSIHHPQQGSFHNYPHHTGSRHENVGRGGGGGCLEPSPTQGTLIPAQDFNPTRDSEALKRAMKGFGCDSRTIINILCQRTNSQRQEIKIGFKAMYGKDLSKELMSHLSGNLQEVMVSLMYPAAEFDAWELRKAMKGVGTDEEALIEILCSRTNSEIHQIKTVYQNIFQRKLEHDLVSETSGHFKRLLVSLSTAGRNESRTVDPHKARQDAQALYKAGEAKLGTDESVFNAVIAAQSYGQLQLVFQEYQRVAGHGIEKAIEREFSGDIKSGLLAIVKCVQNRPAFFADQLYRSMKGLGTNDRQLIRVVVSRAEIDMVQIKQAFLAQYSKSLESWIIGDTSGRYKEALLFLVRGFDRNPAEMKY